MAKVDVVVPCYNYARFLEQCVGSVLNQSVDDVRVLIIDDASSDDSAVVARELAAKDRRIEARVHTSNLGHIKTYNEGIDWADSDYFMVLSADDLLVPGALSRAASIMDNEPQVVLTYGKGVDWEDNLPFPTVDPEQSNAWTRQDLVHEMCAIGANLVTTPTAIGRTKVQKAIGGYNSKLPHSADMEMWLRYGARGAVARIDAVQAIYRKHTAAMSNAYYRADWGDYWHRKATFDSFFADESNAMPDFDGLRIQASQSLAKQAVARGADLVRSGVRLADRARIAHGMELLRLSKKLDADLGYGYLLRHMLRAPGAEARLWPGAVVKQAAAKLKGGQRGKLVR